MNLDWIAGFFDGEGSVSLQFHKMPTCKYGYQFLPSIVVTQKNRQILEEVQSFLKLGRLYSHGVGMWTLEIRRQSEIKQFISDFLPRSQLKKRQLLLLRDALELLHNGPLRGDQLWGGALPKDNILRLLDIVKEIRSLNGIRGKRTNDIGVVRKSVQEFDEGAYQKRVRAGWLKRIAPLIAHKQQETDRIRPPETIRDLYWGQGLSAHEIAIRLGCSKKTILRQMRRHGIPRRNEDEARRVHYGLNLVREEPMR